MECKITLPLCPPTFLFVFLLLNAFFLTAISPMAGDDSNRLPKVDVSDDEVKQIVAELWTDEARQWPSLHVNFQGHTTGRDPKDEAPERLFQFVNDRDVFKSEPAVKLRTLFDNYNPNKGVPERETPEERTEIDDFLDLVLASSHFQKLYAFLKAKQHPFAQTARIFRKWIRQLWFDLYSREGNARPADSSGFEHVFVGELDGDKVDGLHNWIRFYVLEKNASEHFDYRGFVVKRSNILGAFKFTWKDELKPTGSFLLGTSPEFEMAVDTLCFLLKRGRNRCKIELDGCSILVSSFDLVWRGKVYVGTAYPSAGRMTSQCGGRNTGQNNKF